MPSHDGGHVFLTVLIPIRTDAVVDRLVDSAVTSHLHALREVLAAMPTALQSPATEHIGINSPFARDRSTHFARLAVIDTVAFNGRGARDPIKVALFGPPPSQFDPVDRLDGAYLLYVSDIDAGDGSDAAIDTYLRGLWSVMEPEWRAILQHCHGYERVDGPTGFAKLIRDCQIETTMPFSDYWQGAPPLQPLSLKPFIYGAIGSVAALGIGLLGALVAAFTPMRAGMWLLLALVGLIALGVTAWLAYRKVMAEGGKPLPAAPRSDLPSVLKALYLQQHFTRLAIAVQGKDAATLHAAFGEFLRTHKPNDVAAPTQPPGVVRS